jgi:hypothetical protein
VRGGPEGAGACRLRLAQARLRGEAQRRDHSAGAGTVGGVVRVCEGARSAGRNLGFGAGPGRGPGGAGGGRGHSNLS